MTIDWRIRVFPFNVHQLNGSVAKFLPMCLLSSHWKLGSDINNGKRTVTAAPSSVLRLHVSANYKGEVSTTAISITLSKYLFYDGSHMDSRSPRMFMLASLSSCVLYCSDSYCRPDSSPFFTSSARPVPALLLYLILCGSELLSDIISQSLHRNA